MKSWYAIRAADATKTAEVLIYDEIGLWGVSARQFVEDLKALRAPKAITVRINSPGGDVFDGHAIYNALRRHPATITAVIDGLAASIASVVAMAASEILMPANAMLMIHDPHALVVGTAADMRAMAEALDRIKGGLISAYRRSGQDDDEIARLMADETWMTAQEAVDLGFADAIEEPVRIAARFDLSRFKHVPKEARAMATKRKDDDPADPKITDPQPSEDAPDAPPEPPTQTGDEPTDEPTEEPTEQPTEEPTEQPTEEEKEYREVPRNPPGYPAPPDPAGITQAHAATLAYARDIVDLCTLAGAAERIADFLRREVPVADVRASLLRIRAERDATSAVDGGHLPARARAPGAAWATAIDRTFKSGTEL